MKGNHNAILLPAKQGFGTELLPAIVSREGESTSKRFFEFFTVNIRNPNTRQAYGRAAWQFLEWCEQRGLTLATIEPMHVAAYIEKHPGAPQTVKQHLAGIRMLFDWLVVGQVVRLNPAAAVRGPRHSYRKGKTPILSAEDARALFDSIDVSHVVGKRDRALMGLMVFSFARVGAVTAMAVEDYYQNGKRWWVRLHEKGGKFHEMPVHHTAEEYLDDYIKAAGIAGERKTPLFRTTKGRTRLLTGNGMSRTDALMVVKRRVSEAGLSQRVCNHSFRATGITNYLENGGQLETAAQMAAHESTRTTGLYDRRSDLINLDEVERIRI
ncbi:MAG: tyrosine-type recombinase/integrase [Fimbriimonadaceae bacterium]|nr:tyrosine-type recombinase/integrase [Fimbriimonadaceae bacterium]